jgi:hypothetical protein
MMYCSKCNADVEEGARACSRCGGSLLLRRGVDLGSLQTSLSPSVRASEFEHRPTSVLAILGFIFSFFFSVVGLVLSILAKNEIKRSQNRLAGDGLATAGIVISVAGMLVWFFIILGYIAMLAPRSY